MQFLDLPRELRDAIYTFALCPHGAGGGDLKVKWPPTDYRGAPSEEAKLALFATSHQTRTEVLPIYYSHKVFHVDRSDSLRHLIRQHNATHIRAISLAPSRETPYHRAAFTSALRKLSQLEYLELRITEDSSFISNLPYRPSSKGLSLAQKLENDRNTRWVMSMSGLSHFRIRWMMEQCTHPQHAELDDPDCCPSCGGWRVLRREVEACVRAEVMQQPRMPYGQSPTHRARMDQQNRAWRQSKFRAEIRNFQERMRMESEHPEMRALREELMARFAS